MISRVFCLLALLVLPALALGEDAVVDALVAKAKAGDAAAQFDLATLYLSGQGVPEDPKMAANWFSKAAEKGDRDAQFNLGMMYDKGIGVERDPKLAANWLTLAAKQGDADAQARLADMYHQGDGVERDDKLAYQWIYLAAMQRDANSTTAKNRAMMAEQLGPAATQEIEDYARSLAAQRPAETGKVAAEKPSSVDNATARITKPPTVSSAEKPTEQLADKPVETTAEKPAEQSTTSATKSSTPKTTAGRWAVQVASLSTQANADDLVRKLKKKNFHAFSITRQTDKNKTFQVLVGPLADKDSAGKTKQSIDKAISVKSLVVPFGTS